MGVVGGSRDLLYIIHIQDNQINGIILSFGGGGEPLEYKVRF